MKIKFSKFERVAGLFVLTAVLGTVFSFVSIAIQKGWFERKIPLRTTFETADGLTPGTQVHMNGLKVGAVEDVILSDDNHVNVNFYVSEAVISKVKEDSVVRTFRPFIIGDRVLEITVGSKGAKNIQPNGELLSETSMDIMDLVGGRKLGPYMESFGETMDSLSILLDAFKQPERVQSIIEVFDALGPTLLEMKQMSVQVKKIGWQLNGKRRLRRTLDNLYISTNHLNTVLPEFATLVKESPDLGKNAARIVSNMAELTDQMKLLIPAIAEVAPELPQASRRAIEAMNEAVITLKAMQKSFLLRSAVEDVMEEEEEKRKQREKERLPAGEVDESEDTD